jgi:hypothetical protein
MPAKTEASRRTIRPLPGVVEALRRRRTEQGREREAAESHWLEHDLVFSNEIGRPVESLNRQLNGGSRKRYVVS